MFSSMALLWKPCFQVWPFHGNHVFNYCPFMETMFLKYGTLIKHALLLLSSQNTSHISTHLYFWKWHLLLEAQHNLNPCFQRIFILLDRGTLIPA